MRTETLRIKDLCWNSGYSDIIHNFSMYVYEGEIIGIVGLHDSGKSLLLNIISGAEKPSSGMFFLNERRTPGFGKSVYLVSSETVLIDNLTVADNIFIIRKHEKPKFILNYNAMCKMLGEQFSQLGINIPPNAKVGMLTENEKRIISVIKGYVLGAKIILIDDVLDGAAADLESLSELIQKLAERKISFIITGRHFESLQSSCDRIVFLSNGAAVKTVKNIHRKQIDADKILLGKALPHVSETSREISKEVVFKACKISGKTIDNISFELHKGEIMVIYDIYRRLGNELISLIENPKNLSAGYIEKPPAHKTFLSDFKLKNAIIGFMPLADNLCLQSYKKLSNMGFINRRLIRFIRDDFIKNSIAPVYGDKCLSLSERQKMSIFLYRLRLFKPDFLICVYPELVPDSVNYSMIEKTFQSLSQSGTAICILCSNLDKLHHIADKFIMFDKEKLYGIFAQNDSFLK